MPDICTPNGEGLAVGLRAAPTADTAALRLAVLLAARLSHDLSGPLSGLGAALGEIGEDVEALALAQDSALVLRRRLELFRAAWGGGTAPLGRAALRDLAGGLPNAARLQLELGALAEAPAFGAASGQVLTSAMLLAAESLSGGGMVALAGNPAGTVVVTIAGPGAAWPIGLGAMLASAEAAWQAIAGLVLPAGLRLLPGPVLALLARQAGVRAALLLAGRAEAVPPLLLDFSAAGSA
jgi:hypothetical protein